VSGEQRSTVLWLVEQSDGGGVADTSLRALTFARSLADAALSSAASSAAAASQDPASASEPAEPASWMDQKARSSVSNGPSTAAGQAARNDAAPDGVAGDAADVDEVSDEAAQAGDVTARAAAVAGGPGAGGPNQPGGPGGVVAVVFGDAASVPVSELSSYGVSDAYAVDSAELTGYAPQAWARALAGLADELAATAVVAAGTDHGSEVMAHLGAITGLPMAANCVSAARNAAGALELVRHRWAGSLLEDAVLEAGPALLTVAVDAVAPAAAEQPAATSVHAYRPVLEQADLRVSATESAERSAGLSLATARVVVGGGRGVGGPDGFGVLEELAGLLGGVVGVSRVVTSEGWRPHRQQVGQTGTRISPELYLACGISGAIQHMAGCLSAKHIVAVNTDPDAPIISHADYAVIGDLNQVLPALVAAIRARSS
jgi:electron transfer flavoprotein alpha subunit